MWPTIEHKEAAFYWIGPLKVSIVSFDQLFRVSQAEDDHMICWDLLHAKHELYHWATALSLKELNSDGAAFISLSLRVPHLIPWVHSTYSAQHNQAIACTVFVPSFLPFLLGGEWEGFVGLSGNAAVSTLLLIRNQRWLWRGCTCFGALLAIYRKCARGSFGLIQIGSLIRLLWQKTGLLPSDLFTKALKWELQGAGK